MAAYFPRGDRKFWGEFCEHPSTDNHTNSARWLSAPEPFTCPWSRFLNQKRPLKIHGFTRWPMRICQRSKLVGGWTNPSEKIFKSNWTSSPSKGENSNKKLKPPSSKDEFQLTKTSLENNNLETQTDGSLVQFFHWKTRKTHTVHLFVEIMEKQIAQLRYVWVPEEWCEFSMLFFGQTSRWRIKDPQTSFTNKVIWSILKFQLSHEKNPPTFHYTGCLIGILIMVYYNALYNWVL